MTVDAGRASTGVRPVRACSRAVSAIRPVISSDFRSRTIGLTDLDDEFDLDRCVQRQDRYADRAAGVLPRVAEDLAEQL